jgi:hypothetical protein
MATHELYIGGPPTSNYSRSMFPAPPFNAGAQWALDLKPSAHKGPVDYSLGRVFQPGTGANNAPGNANDFALQEFIRNNVVAQADVLGMILVPQNCIFHGVFYNNKAAVGAAMVLTPSLRGVAGGTFPTINGNAVAKGFGKVGSTAWQAASGSIEDAADGTAFFIAAPTILDLTLTTLTAEADLLDLSLEIIPIITMLQTGRY